MGEAGGEEPEVAFFKVGNEAAALRVDGGYAGVAVEHEGPFGGGVPVEFSDAAFDEAHINAGDC